MSAASHSKYLSVCAHILHAVQSAALLCSSAQMQGQQRHAQEAAWRQQDAQLSLAQAELAGEIQQRREQLQELLQRSAALDEQRCMVARKQSYTSQVGGSYVAPDNACLV